jgi:hypothetical protein
MVGSRESPRDSSVSNSEDPGNVFFAGRCYVTLLKRSVATKNRRRLAAVLLAKRAEERKSQLSRGKKICKPFGCLFATMFHRARNILSILATPSSYGTCIHCRTRESVAFSWNKAQARREETAEGLLKQIRWSRELRGQGVYECRGTTYRLL